MGWTGWPEGDGGSGWAQRVLQGVMKGVFSTCVYVVPNIGNVINTLDDDDLHTGTYVQGFELRVTSYTQFLINTLHVLHNIS